MQKEEPQSNQIINIEPNRLLTIVFPNGATLNCSASTLEGLIAEHMVKGMVVQSSFDMLQKHPA